jgi:flagellar hook protein FlgE
MSLYGALFTGVSGLSSQGQKIGIISDNISNVNTVGYKKAEANFQTLVVTQAGASTYAPGGARANARYNINTQGLLSSTSSPTDIAISGNGMFVVNTQSGGNGQSLYTRAGSFRQDETGNFRNAAGYYLMAWPLNADGLKPGEPGNLNTAASSTLDSLSVVNVESAQGVATATTQIDLGMNLDSSEDVYLGAGATITMDQFSAANFGISADDIIVPDETSATPPSFGLAVTNGIARGDQITLATGNGLNYDYQYGGFTMGRQVTTSGATNVGDGAVNLTATSFAAGEIATDGATNTVTVTLGATLASLGYATGDRIKLSGVTWAGADTIPLSEVNTTQTITATGANTFTFNVATTSTVADANAATGSHTDRLFTGNVFDATTATQAFFSTTSLAGFTSAARSFTITSPTAGTSTFTYTSGSPSTSAGQFNNLTNLATAIDDVVGLSARIVNGRLVVGAEDASESLTFANVDSVGTSALDGIDWVSELDVADVAVGSRRFSTMQGLNDLVNADEGVSAVLTDPLGETSLELHVDDPLDTLQITDFLGTSQTLAAGAVTVAAAAAGAQTVTITLPGHGLSVGDNIVLANMTPFQGFTASELNAVHTVTSVTGANTFTITINSSAAIIAGAGNTDGDIANTNRGSLLAEFGLVDSLQGTTTTPAVYVRGDTGVLGPEYDSSGVTGHNMASGDITAQFSRTVRIYDSLGDGHDIRYSYIKIADNEWAVEVHAVNEDEVNSSLVDGQIAVGTITFNGDGSLRQVSSTLTNDVTVNWTNGALPSDINMNFGTSGLPSGTVGASQIGLTDGMTQFSADYNVAFVNQNGAPVGELVGVSIDEAGFVIVSYSNGESKALFQIPLADFVNPDGLQPQSGNVYSQTQDSGELNLRDAGTNGTGTVVSSSLEQSNVDLASELTDMIVAQRAYQANTRVISTADELLDKLNQI